METIKYESAHSLKLGFMLLSLGSNHALSLRSVAVDEEGAIKVVDKLKEFDSCKALDLGQTELMDDGGAVIIGLLGLKSCKLRHLKMDSNGIKDKGLKDVDVLLKNNLWLETLVLSNNNLTKATGKLLAKGLYQNACLKQLDVSNNTSLGDSGGANIFSALKGNDTLRLIHLNHCSLKQKSFIELGKLLKADKINLEEIGAAQNELESILAPSVAESLKMNTHLKVLNLSASGKLKLFGTVSIIESLQENQTLTSIALSGNEIGSDGCEEISRCLSKNHGLQILKLANNQLKDEGCATVVIAAGKMTNLRELDLSYNDIEFVCSQKIANLLSKETCQLVKLDLSCNSIRDRGARAIADGLVANHSLQELDLSSNAITDSGGVALAKGLEENNSLKVLVLTENAINAQGLSALSRLLDQNKTLSEIKLTSRLAERIDQKLKLNQKERKEMAKEAILSAVTKLDKVSWNRAKLMIVGAKGSGKTALLSSLLGEYHSPASGVKKRVGVDTLPSVLVKTNSLKSEWVRNEGTPSGLEDILLRAGAKQLEAGGNDEQLSAEIRKRSSHTQNLPNPLYKQVPHLPHMLSESSDLSALNQSETLSTTRRPSDEKKDNETDVEASSFESFPQLEKPSMTSRIKGMFDSARTKSRNIRSVDVDFSQEQGVKQQTKSKLTRSKAKPSLSNILKRPFSKRHPAENQGDHEEDEDSVIFMDDESKGRGSSFMSVIFEEEANQDKETMREVLIDPSDKNEEARKHDSPQFKNILNTLTFTPIKKHGPESETESLPHPSMNARNNKKDRRKVRMSNLRYLMGGEELDKRFSGTRMVNRVFEGDQESDEGEASLNLMIWDYAGDKSYHSLQHLFLTSGGVFLVVFNLAETYKQILEMKERKKVDPSDKRGIQTLQEVDKWLNMIKLHAGSSPVIIIGTHRAYLKNEKQLKRINDKLKLLPSIKLNHTKLHADASNDLLFFAVENQVGNSTLLRKNDATNQVRINAIHSAIEGAVIGLKSVKEKVPVRWIRCLDQIFHDEDSFFLKFQEVQRMAKNCGVLQRLEIMEMLNLFHKLGVIYYLSNSEKLSGFVTLNPQWLIENISMITPSDLDFDKVLDDGKLRDGLKAVELEGDLELFRRSSIASKSLLGYLWGLEPADFMIDLLERTMLIARWTFPIEANSAAQQFPPPHADRKPSILADFPETAPPMSATQSYFIVPAGPLMKEIEGVEEDFMQIYENVDEIRSCILNFSQNFLPDGVFERLVSLCSAYSGILVSSGKARIPIPELSKNRCLVSFGEELPIVAQLRPEENCIEILFPMENTDPGRSLKVFLSFVHKVNNDVMSQSLVWDVFFRKGGRDERVLTFEAAKKREKFKDLFVSKETGKAVEMDVEHYEHIKMDYYLFLELL